MPAVIFQALWLVSERDTSARRITFSPTKNLLAGENETGKSRVLKHLVWALGFRFSGLAHALAQLANHVHSSSLNGEPKRPSRRK